jgi:hypothetical protein
MRTTAAIALVAAALGGCASSEHEELAVSCAGKCDGFDSIKSLVADARKLDVGDLISIGASFATEELNDQLSLSDYARLQLGPTSLYALPEVARDDLTLKNIDALVSGLAARFGESALTTEVNAIRADELRESGNRVYGESAFKIGGGLNHGWSLGTFGFGDSETGAATLGFDAGGELEARVIAAFPREGAAVIQGPLRSIKEVRGFVLPRSVDDVRRMAPGESFALSGRGRLGMNVGAGVPILIAEPTSFLTYSLVLTAGLRAMLEGAMDVQLVRMRDAEVVLDVGMQTSSLRSAHVALRDGWGVQGLIESKIGIGGVEVDLGRLVEKAIEQRLNSTISLLEAEASRTRKRVRVSVARLRFDLAAADPTGGRDAALAQALRGDVRLAQALAARGDSGVLAEFDLARSGVSAVSHAGIEILGMHFFTTLQATEGQAVIQTPGGALALLFESLHKVSGWFFTSHGYTRVGLAGLMFDGGTGEAVGETNLFVQVEEGDKRMARDKIVDHLDPILWALAGPSALEAMERPANELERLITALCPLPADSTSFSEACNRQLLASSPEVARLRREAREALAGALGGLDPATRDFILALGDLRIAAQSIQDPEGNGGAEPPSSIVVNLRLDDGALKHILTTRDGRALENAVLATMKLAAVKRTEPDLAARRDRIASAAQPVARRMAELFDARADEYKRLVAVETAAIEGLGMIGPSAIEIRFAVDASKRPKYDEAVSRSVAQARSQVATALFDGLRRAAKDLPGDAPHAEQAAFYGLLALAPVERIDLRLDFKASLSCTLCFPFERYKDAGFGSLDTTVRGPAVSRIAAGLFDVDALLEI